MGLFESGVPLNPFPIISPTKLTIFGDTSISGTPKSIFLWLDLDIFIESPLEFPS